MSTLAGTSRGDVFAGSESAVSPLSPVHQDLCLPTVSSQNSNTDPHVNDTPTAPLPPALWPGLMLLLSLGGIKVGLIARRRIARG
ncbi:MAG TPA: hypothetical protein VFE47_10590 [Tepidisphaeraceae bacterium]|nr:hypothetical protein [Tepidisphaeraceae bacterium]